MEPDDKVSSSMDDVDFTGDLFRLDGRTAVITGGAGMLAQEFAKALLDAGACVVLADVDACRCEERVLTLLKDRDDTGQRVWAAELDVSRKDKWEQMTREVMDRSGHIDILVNNAAITNASRSEGYSANFLEFGSNDWNQVIGVNLTGAFLGCQVIGGHMLRRGKGAIINIASMYGITSPHHRIYEGTGVAQPVAYSVSKAGIIALTRYLATLWAEKGIRVNSLTPGGVYDNQSDTFLRHYRRLSPAGRMADRREMRGALIYLASDASSYCNGHNLVVDGGWTVW
jgi:NAD(P)-dependent dehydrogenase (short-subunit alcohol dehydrogenase family)